MSRVAVLLALGVALAGCGGSARVVSAPVASARPTATAVSTAQHPRARFAAAAVRRLDAGAAGVIGFDLRGAVAPATLMVNKEQTLEGVRWSGWGGASASGRARVRTLVCDPTCAEGRLQLSDATIVLSRLQRCGRRRFYTRGRMTYLDPDTHRTIAPSVFLWGPHCPGGNAPASSTSGAPSAAAR